MPAYATRVQFEDAIEGWVTDDPDALDRLLERATTDIDQIMGARRQLTTGTYAGRKFDPTILQTFEADALAAATIAQAYYRWQIDEARAARAATGAAGGTRRSETGPDFSVTYDTPADPVTLVQTAGTGRYGPDVPGALEPIAHLRRLTGRARP